MTGALIRYIGSDAARSQRWIAPLVVFVGATAIINADAGPLLTTYAASIGFLFPIAVWLTWVVVNSEDPVVASITAVTVGSGTRLRLTKLLTAFLGAAALGIFAVLLPLALANHPDRVTLGHVAGGAFGHVLVSAAGVALGSLLMQSVIPGAGWAFVVASSAIIVEFAVPHAPPVRQVLVLFNEDSPTHLGAALARATAATALWGVVTVGVALRIARRRS